MSADITQLTLGVLPVLLFFEGTNHSFVSCALPEVDKHTIVQRFGVILPLFQVHQQTQCFCVGAICICVYMVCVIVHCRQTVLASSGVQELYLMDLMASGQATGGRASLNLIQQVRTPGSLYTRYTLPFCVPFSQIPRRNFKRSLDLPCFCARPCPILCRCSQSGSLNLPAFLARGRARLEDFDQTSERGRRRHLELGHGSRRVHLNARGSVFFTSQERNGWRVLVRMDMRRKEM